MKKFLASSLIFFTLTLSGVFAIDVNERELKSTGDEGTIVFENYSGPHAVIETVEAIKAIGSGLGNRLKANGLDKEATVGANEKYTVIHAVDETKGKLDADILIINSNATVDHIRNLRRIIGAYLSAAYGYSEKDAGTVATFVTVYNAVYRQNLDAFNGKYKDIVTKNLTASKCGLSTKWSEWPGNSQIVIPLGEFADGGLSAVETSVISDKNVVNSMKEEDDKGIDERKNMVDIKEREADAASEKAQEAAKEASQEKKNLDDQKKVQKNAEKEAADKKATADKKQQEADKAKQEAKENPNDKEKQQEAAAKQSEADKSKAEAESAQKKAAEEKEKTEEQKSKVEEALAAAEELQKKADKKQDEAQNERQEIAKDQSELLKDELQNAKDGTVLGLKVLDSDEKLSTLVKINAKTGEVVRESPVKVIRGRTVLEVRDPIIDTVTNAIMPAKSSDAALFYMAVCGENAGKGAVKLCLIDAFTMEIQKESDEALSKDSVLVTNGSNYYCVIEDNGKYYIANYDKSVTLKQKSSISVNPATAITVTGSGLVVTTDRNESVLLTLSDLSLVTTYDTSNAK
ncbi:P83/100 family protein [Treponema sp.]|uniref:P83/100 family protein n=1 Tax=Treponema sp. TaxID=166 RepID=UPI00298E803C|nr:P83/100 family protein [Treponema sp.]MCQ2241459.1 hypothetical protein [Treponema sp.]